MRLGLLSLWVCGSALAGEPAVKPSDLLSRDEVGATAWTKAHPLWDGRGVVIAVLDTGVDPSASGLRALPDGRPKVIVMRDFSGEGAVALSRPTKDGAALKVGGESVIGIDKIPDKPRGDYWLGFFDEATLDGSDVSDLDGDEHHDTQFAVLAFERQDGTAVALVDTDGDHDLSDEVVRQSYADEPKTFTFVRRDRDPQKNRAPVAVSLHIDLAAHSAELVFDDDGHGTHCAGIAAGYRIDGQEGLDGIAPGAELMGIKIGHGGLAGGASTAGSMARGIRYVSQWAREHQRPVVVNMSYGIGSEREGYGQIDKILDDELQGNPWLAVALSGSNEGPGLSNVGMPSSTVLAFSSAAMLPEGNAKTLLGANTKGKKVFAFSSRGGELSKPDGLAPGIAWSTTPPFKKNAISQGTSMASPQSAGVHALLASAALATKLPWTNGLAHRALVQGAKPIPGYGPLDQGAGLLNVAAAWEAYQREAKQPGATRVAGWRVATSVPSAPGQTAQASYWRVGQLPEATEAITFTVTPLLYTSETADARAAHMDTITLSSDVGWLSVDRTAVPLRGTSAVDIVVRMDASGFDRSGVYVGRVRGTTRGVHAFWLPVVVIVPESFGPGIGWGRAFEGSLAPGDLARHFVMVPPGATSVSADISVSGSYGNVWLLPFDPGGVGVESYEHHASIEESLSGSFVRGGKALTPGIWELVVVAPSKNRAASKYRLDVAFHGLELPARVNYRVSSTGEMRADVKLTNRLDETFRGDIEASASAITRTRSDSGEGPKRSVSVAFGSDMRALEVTLELDDETWERMTDVAVKVRDAGGTLVSNEAFSQRRLTISLDTPGTYSLDFIAGLADPDDQQPWKVAVTETQRRRSPPSFSIELPDRMPKATLYPGVPTPIALATATALPEAPDGFEHLVELVFRSKDGAIWARVELPLDRTASLRRP